VTRAAAIDCGTNSVRLLVADIDDTGLHEIVRRMEIVRLGQGVDRTGRLSDAGLDRTFRMLDEYAALIRSTGAEAVRMVATSATREPGRLHCWGGAAAWRVAGGHQWG
jgi:exopolyphosphatase / guanosine-5'-triphosphate,3'-diphosphate pyrophosphatase